MKVFYIKTKKLKRKLLRKINLKNNIRIYVKFILNLLFRAFSNNNDIKFTI